jgi:hypothetical protein
MVKTAYILAPGNSATNGHLLFQAEERDSKGLDFSFSLSSRS